MAKLTIVIGLPGSGKTTHIGNNYENDILVADDFMKESVLSEPEFPFSQHYCNLIERLRSGKDSLISDIKFCDNSWRENALSIITNMVLDVTIEQVFFENNPEQCIYNANVRKRPNIVEEIEVIQRLSINYTIPTGASVIPVYVPPPQA